MANKNALKNLVAGVGRLPEEGFDENQIIFTKPDETPGVIDLNQEIDFSSDDQEVDPLDITKQDLDVAKALQENKDHPVDIASGMDVETQDLVDVQKREEEKEISEIEELNQEIEEKSNRILELESLLNDSYEIQAKEINNLKSKHEKEILEIKETLQNEVDSLNEKNSNLEETLLEVCDLEDKNSNLEEENSRLEKEISNLKRNNSRLITTHEQKVAELTSKNEELQSKIDSEISTHSNIDVDSIRNEIETEWKEKLENKETEWKEKLENNETEWKEKLQEVLDSQEDSTQSEKVISESAYTLHKFILNFVCKKLIISITDDYESKIYTKEFASDLLNKFIAGKIDSQDSFLQALLQEAKNKEIKNEFLGEVTSDILSYLLEHKVELQ